MNPKQDFEPIETENPQDSPSDSMNSLLRGSLLYRQLFKVRSRVKEKDDLST